MKKLFIRYAFLLMFSVLLGSFAGSAQNIHFSQYYNAPMLINPANTGLMPEYDFRLGLNYRNQWEIIPVPYNTFSGFADCKVGGNKENSNNNWLGVGLAYFYDIAGSGNLTLSEFQFSSAYHLQTSQHTMFSLGLSGMMASTTVNYDLLTFDQQWDGQTFNTQFPNGEKGGVQQAGFYSVAAGFNFAWFPTESVYFKLGGGVSNLNKPVVTFYGSKNTLDMRETGNLDMFFHLTPMFTLNPSVYFTTQSGAMELTAGSLVRTNLSGPYQPVVTQLILGGFMRAGDAAIGVIGFQYANVQFVANYDLTISNLAPYNDGYGALEFSLIYQGVYGKNKDRTRKMLGCPRFM